jgi:excisionase family DNA binding protein
MNARCGTEGYTTEPILLSKRQAAKLLSISVRTLDSLIASKKLPIRKIGRRVLIAKKSLELFATADWQT